MERNGQRGTSRVGGAARRAARAVAALAVAAALGGCYRLVPVNAETAAPPMRVRAFLTDEGAVRVAPILGQPRTELSGQLVERTSEGIYLEVPSAMIAEGFGTEVLTQRILLAPGELVALQRRELDRTRTGLLVGAGAALVGAILYDQLSGESGGTVTRPPTGGPPETRIPLLRLPIR